MLSVPCHSERSIVVVDNFYGNPDAVRAHALALEYNADNRFYKGRRSGPVQNGAAYIQGILGIQQIRDFYSCFQKTTSADPIVYHSDQQKWAGAVYLTPGRVGAGTSFWRDKQFKLRHPSTVPAENAIVYATPNLTSPDTWELVDRIGSVYNRLVLWRADLIHSATTYEGFTDDSPRLAQLMFFNG